MNCKSCKNKNCGYYDFNKDLIWGSDECSHYEEDKKEVDKKRTQKMKTL